MPGSQLLADAVPHFARFGMLITMDALDSSGAAISVRWKAGKPARHRPSRRLASFFAWPQLPGAPAVFLRA